MKLGAVDGQMVDTSKAGRFLAVQHVDVDANVGDIDKI